MLPIRGVYEIAIRVKDLARAEAFYTQTLGLTEGIRDTGRNWLFLRAGGNAGMTVLQDDKASGPHSISHHGRRQPSGAGGEGSC
jgi:catechol 2,3-dioxygenase-like lactoylglutathione lyase family enzyme